MTTIAEEVLLLAYSEAEGRQLIGSSELDAALGGAILAELAINDRIDLAGKQVTVRDATPLGDEELDAALARIAGEPRERKPEWWVQKFHSAKLRKRLLSRLAERGVLREEQHKILGIFPSTRYPERDPSIEQGIRERVQSVLSGTDPDERIAGWSPYCMRPRSTARRFPTRAGIASGRSPRASGPARRSPRPSRRSTP